MGIDYRIQMETGSWPARRAAGDTRKSNRVYCAAWTGRKISRCRLRLEGCQFLSLDRGSEVPVAPISGLVFADCERKENDHVRR